MMLSSFVIGMLVFAKDSLSSLMFISSSDTD